MTKLKDNNNDYLQEVNSFIDVCDRLDTARLRFKSLFKRHALKVSNLKENFESLTQNQSLRNFFPDETTIFNIFNKMPDIAWIKSSNGKFIAINDMFEEAYGVKKEFIIGRTCYDIWPKEMADSFNNDDKSVIEAKRQKTIIKKFSDKNGNSVWLEFIKMPLLGPDNEVIGIFGITRDITEYQKMNEQLSDQIKLEALEILEMKNKLDIEFKQRHLIEEKLKLMLNKFEGSNKNLIDVGSAVNSSMNYLVYLTGLLRNSNLDEATAKQILAIEEMAMNLITSVDNIISPPKS